MLTLPPELHPYVRKLLVDPALQARLGALQAPEEFVAMASTSAEEASLPIDAQALGACLLPDPLGLGRWAAAPVTLDGWPAEHWLPARSVETGAAPAFDWAWFGPDRLAEPMFEDSVRWATSLPLNLLCRTRTSLDALIAGAQDEVVPAGFIYHMSRCGSTLLGQMLRAAPGLTVVSEAEPLDAVLLWAWRTNAPFHIAVPAVRAMVAALARPRGAGDERCVFKLDAWHVMLMPLLRAAFPDVPWVYLFRDPLEVLVSHVRQPGVHMVAGVIPGALLGIPDGHLLTPADYSAQALVAIGEAALTGLADQRGLAVEYPALVDAAPGAIASHFDLDLDENGRSAMLAAAQWNAKAPQQRFSDDSAWKRAAVTDEIAAALSPLAVIHTKLQKMSSPSGI